MLLSRQRYSFDLYYHFVETKVRFAQVDADRQRRRRASVSRRTMPGSSSRIRDRRWPELNYFESYSGRRKYRTAINGFMPSFLRDPAKGQARLERCFGQAGNSMTNCTIYFRARTSPQGIRVVLWREDAGPNVGPFAAAPANESGTADRHTYNYVWHGPPSLVTALALKSECALGASRVGRCSVAFRKFRTALTRWCPRYWGCS